MNYYNILIALYFIINSFFTGRNLGNYNKRYKTIWAVVFFLMGSLFVLVKYLVGVLGIIYRLLNKYFVVTFFWKYYIKKDFYNVPKYRLKEIENICNNIKNKNTVPDKIFRYGASLMFKRNNYIPKCQKQENLDKM